MNSYYSLADDYFKKNFVAFLQYIKNLDESKNLQKQINELYNEFECCDFDLCKFDKKNKYEIEVKKILDYYYDNIENVINHPSTEGAINFIRQLKKYCLTHFNEIMEYLETE